jgi:hypothetical protein
MLEFDHIVDAVHGLSHEEKFKLRLLLDKDLKTSSSPAQNGVIPTKGLIGLFADEPELMDRVMEAVYERRSRPLRLDQ